MVTLEKRTISYLSVSARIRVIDPFSQMKREYNTILDDETSFPGSLIFPPKRERRDSLLSRLGGKMRDPENEVVDDADSANRNNFVPSQSFT